MGGSKKLLHRAIWAIPWLIVDPQNSLQRAHLPIVYKLLLRPILGHSFKQQRRESIKSFSNANNPIYDPSYVVRDINWHKHSRFHIVIPSDYCQLKFSYNYSIPKLEGTQMNCLIPVLLGICLLATPLAEAWNKAGHWVSAAIVYSDLKERNPTVLANVIDILNDHPEVKSEWADKLDSVPQSDRVLYLLMLPAEWPDDVRKKYPKGWHFINIPYRPGELDVTIPDGAYIIEAFSQNRSIVKSATSTSQDRAKAFVGCSMPWPTFINLCTQRN